MEIFDKPLRKYGLFFSVLDYITLTRACARRKPIRKSEIARTLIFKNLRGIANLYDLSAALYRLPVLAFIRVFEPIPVERFSCFLKDNDNKTVQEVRKYLIKKFIKCKILKGKYLSVDSWLM